MVDLIRRIKLYIFKKHISLIIPLRRSLCDAHKGFLGAGGGLTPLVRDVSSESALPPCGSSRDPFKQSKGAN